MLSTIIGDHYDIMIGDITQFQKLHCYDWIGVLGHISLNVYIQYSPYNFPNADKLQNMLSLQYTQFQYQTLRCHHSDAHYSKLDGTALLW